jgi:hypothetical protein
MVYDLSGIVCSSLSGDKIPCFYLTLSLPFDPFLSYLNNPLHLFIPTFFQIFFQLQISAHCIFPIADEILLNEEREKTPFLLPYGKHCVYVTVMTFKGMRVIFSEHSL